MTCFDYRCDVLKKEVRARTKKNLSNVACAYYRGQHRERINSHVCDATVLSTRQV